jgi:hypothetical protein
VQLGDLTVRPLELGIPVAQPRTLSIQTPTRDSPLGDESQRRRKSAVAPVWITSSCSTLIGCRAHDTARFASRLRPPGGRTPTSGSSPRVPSPRKFRRNRSR